MYAQRKLFSFLFASHEVQREMPAIYSVITFMIVNIPDVLPLFWLVGFLSTNHRRPLIFINWKKVISKKVLLTLLISGRQWNKMYSALYVSIGLCSVADVHFLSFPVPNNERMLSIFMLTFDSNVNLLYVLNESDIVLGLIDLLLLCWLHCQCVFHCIKKHWVYKKYYRCLIVDYLYPVAHKGCRGNSEFVHCIPQQIYLYYIGILDIP